MLQMSKQKIRILVLVIAGTLALVGSALAEKPSWAGDADKGGKHEQKKKSNGKKGHDADNSRGQGSNVQVKVYFGDHHREVIRTYYQDQYRSGQCPPGLAKKNNGCLPPGQAKKWVIGQPLPQGIIVYELPQVIVTQLGPPPPGNYYVRVDADILLLTIGTMMVVDALQNLAGN